MFMTVMHSGQSWSRSQVLQKYSIIKSPNSRTTMLTDNSIIIIIIIMHLLCYIVKHFL
jgi:hypothetical protein